jgi:hypothetical protein
MPSREHVKTQRGLPRAIWRRQGRQSQTSLKEAKAVVKNAKKGSDFHQLRAAVTATPARFF